jgi:trimethylamine--corrinoid protein Co-methyltransferase
MESDLTVSYEKLVIDNEILGMIQRVLRGIEVNDTTLAADLMIEKGPGGDFMGERHTVRHMRKEFFFPKLANRHRRETCRPDDDALARARAFVAEVRSSEPETCLPEEVRQVIRRSFPEILG